MREQAFTRQKQLTSVQEWNVVVLNAWVQQVLVLEDVALPGVKELQFPETALKWGHAAVPRRRLLKVVVHGDIGGSKEVKENEEILLI